MKNLTVILLLVFTFSLPMLGQEKNGTLTSNNILEVTVPSNLKIKDNIFLINKSPYLILQAMVAIPQPSGGYDLLGSTAYLTADETATIASFDNNGLKKLRGKTIAIKVKGAKVFTGENRTGVATPYGGVGVAHTEISSDLVNNIAPEDITYSFDVKMHEENHDLYIEVYYKGNGKSIMDF